MERDVLVRTESIRTMPRSYLDRVQKEGPAGRGINTMKRRRRQQAGIDFEPSDAAPVDPDKRAEEEVKIESAKTDDGFNPVDEQKHRKEQAKIEAATTDDED